MRRTTAMAAIRSATTIDRGALLLAVLAVIVSSTWGWATTLAADVVRTFPETDESFTHPGQGWMTTRRLPDGAGRFPYSVVYFRLNWGDIEATEGQCNWRLIDESLAAWAKRDARIGFRIMTTNAHSQGYYCSPKWLFDAGCKSYDYVAGGADIAAGGVRIKRIEPDYGDPLYLQKHGRFMYDLVPGFADHWKRAPVVFEWYGPYDYLA